MMGKSTSTNTSLLITGDTLSATKGKVGLTRLAARFFLAIAIFAVMAVLLTGCEPSDPSTSAPPSEATTPDQRDVRPRSATPALSGGRAEESSSTTAEIQDQDNALPDDSGTVLIEVSRDLGSLDVQKFAAGDPVPLPALMMTARISNAPLAEILKELARKTDARVYVAGTMPNKTISVEFELESIENGISQILKGINYTLKYQRLGRPRTDAPGGPEAEELTVTEIHILREGPNDAGTAKPESLVELSKETDAASLARLADQALNAKTPNARLAALSKFLERAEPSEHTALLERVLKDPDDQLRGFALNSLANVADPPLDAISNVATNDPTPTVRKIAMSTLVSQFGAEAIPTLQQATMDSDPNVRKSAQLSLDMVQKVNAELEASPGRRNGN